jgi:hypothetical protein
MNLVSSMPKSLPTALWLVLIQLWKSETYSKPSFRAAKCVPATRAWILAFELQGGVRRLKANHGMSESVNFGVES